MVRNLDKFRSSLHDDLFLKNRIEHWVNFVFNVLNQDSPTFSEWKLKMILEVRVLKSQDEVRLFDEVGFSSLDPRDGLTLRIDHEWIS